MNLAKRIWNFFLILSPIRFIFGRDIFISYARADTFDYTEKLELALNERFALKQFDAKSKETHDSRDPISDKAGEKEKKPAGQEIEPKIKNLSFYLDKYASPPDGGGGKLPQRLKRQLRWSRSLVVLATKEAAKSKWVKKEIKYFSSFNPNVTLINVDDCLSSIETNKSPWSKIRHAFPTSISEDKIREHSVPSPKVVNRIVQSVKFTTQDRRQKQAVWRTGLAVGTILIVGATTAFAVLTSSWTAQEAAEENANIAISSREVAERQTRDARKQLSNTKSSLETTNKQLLNANTELKEAENKVDTAEGQLKNTKQELVTAENQTKNAQAKAMSATAEAQRQLGLAKKAGKEADKQQRIAAATRLANEAEILRTQNLAKLEESVRQASQAVQDLSSLKSPSVTADYTLRTGVSLLRPLTMGIPSNIFSLDPVDDMTFTSDSKFIAIAVNDTVEIWDIDGQANFVTRFSQENVKNVAFTNDNQYLLAASRDGVVNTWQDWSTERASIGGKYEYLVGSKYSISPDGSTFVAARIRNDDIDIVLRETKSNKISQHQILKQKDFKAHMIREVAMVNDGDNQKTIALALLTTKGEEIVQLLRIRNHRLQNVSNILVLSADANSKRLRFIISLILSKDAKYVATAIVDAVGAGAYRDNQVKIWNVRNKRLVSQLSLKAESIDPIAFSPDSTQLVTGSAKGLARIWDIESQLEIARLNTNADLEKLAYSRDGNYLATGRGVESGVPLAKIWNVSKTITEYPIKIAGLVSAVALSPSGRYFAAIDRDHISVWDTRSKIRVADCPYGYEGVPLDQIFFSPNDRYIVVSPFGRNLWKISPDCEEIPTKPLGNEIGFSLNSEFFVSNDASSDLRIGRSQSGEIIAGIPKSMAVQTSALDPEGKRIATAGLNSQEVYIWKVIRSHDITKNQKPLKLAISGKVKRIIWSSNGKYLAIRGGNGEFKLFDSIKNKVIAEATGEGSRSEFVFSGDSRFFAIIRNGKRLQRLKVVELFGGNRTHSLPMTKSGISVTVNPDNEHIAIALEDNTAEIWNLKTKLRANHIILDFGVEDIAFTPDGKYIVGRSNKYNKSAKAWIWKQRDLVEEAFKRLQH